MTLHDNEDDARPDVHAFAQGHVALLLTESILNVLVERSMLTAEDACSAIQTAAEVKMNLAADLGEPNERTQAAIDALFRMMDSIASTIEPSARDYAKEEWERQVEPD